MKSAEVFMAPGEWAVNLVLDVFKISRVTFDGTLYTGLAFIAALIIWARSLRFLADMIKPTPKEK